MDLIGEFEALKISALSKSIKLNASIHDISIGPESVHPQNTTVKVVEKIKKKVEKKEEIKYPPSPNYNDASFKRTLQEMEFQRRENLTNAIGQRYKAFVEFSEKQKSQRHDWWTQRQLKVVEEMKQQERKIIEAVNQRDLEQEAKCEAIAKYYQHLAEQKIEEERGLKERERRKQELKNIIDTIKQVQMAFRKEYMDILVIVRGLEPNVLRTHLMDFTIELKKSVGIIEGVVKNCACGKISKDEAFLAEETLKNIVQLKAHLITKVSQLEAQNSQAKPEPVLEPQPETINQKIVEPVEQPTEIANKDTEGEHPLAEYISKTNLIKYCELQKFVKDYQNKCQVLEQNDQYKQFRFNCKKAVNIPVNAISAVNSQHLLDKLGKLVNLLSGHRVTVGDNVINIQEHPQGIAFCTDLLAKKFVLQGDLTVSSNLDASYVYAYVIANLWKRFPDFGKLLLAKFYQVCPYLVPFYIPKKADQPMNEYYTILGYQFVDGVIEKQDKFLKRMMGTMRLFATILTVKSESDTKDAPYGIEHAWRWLASFLNLLPRPQISATMLHTFLETTGYTLQRTYGFQFKKIMNFVANVYLPKLEKIDSGGPVSRLSEMIKEYQETNGFPRPDPQSLGILEREFLL